MRASTSPPPRDKSRFRSQPAELLSMTDLSALQAETLAAIAGAADEAALEAVRVAALGKKGAISALLATLGKMSPDERKAQGAAINGLKDEVGEALAARRAVLKSAALGATARRRGARRDPALRGRPASRPGASIRSARSGTNSSRSSPIWAFRSPRGRTSRATTIISPCSIFRPAIPRAKCTTRSSSRPTKRANASFCAPTPAPCRCARC